MQTSFLYFISVINLDHFVEIYFQIDIEKVKKACKKLYTGNA